MSGASQAHLATWEADTGSWGARPEPTLVGGHDSRCNGTRAMARLCPKCIERAAADAAKEEGR